MQTLSTLAGLAFASGDRYLFQAPMGYAPTQQLSYGAVPQQVAKSGRLRPGAAACAKRGSPLAKCRSRGTGTDSGYFRMRPGYFGCVPDTSDASRILLDAFRILPDASRILPDASGF